MTGGKCLRGSPCLSKQAHRPAVLPKLQSQFLAMAEIITTNETAPQDDMVVADGAMPHADEVMVDETAESSTGMPMPDAYPAEQVSEATALPERTTTGASRKEMPPSRRPSLQAHASERWTAERPLADPVEAPRSTTSRINYWRWLLQREVDISCIFRSPAWTRALVKIGH